MVIDIRILKRVISGAGLKRNDKYSDNKRIDNPRRNDKHSGPRKKDKLGPIRR